MKWLKSVHQMSTGGPIKGKHVTDGSSPPFKKHPGPNPKFNTINGNSPPNTDEVPALGYLRDNNKTSDPTLSEAPFPDKGDSELEDSSEIYHMADYKSAPSTTVPPDPPPNTTNAYIGDVLRLKEVSGPILEVEEEKKNHDDDTTVQVPNLETKLLLDDIDLDDPETWNFDSEDNLRIDGVAVFFVTTTTGEANTVFVSNSLLDITGRTSAELLGQPIENLVGVETSAKTCRILTEIATNDLNDHQVFNGSLRTPDADDLLAEITYSTVPTLQDEASYIVALYHNIFDREPESDYPVTVDTYTHGSSLGSLCFDIADHVATQLGSGTKTWIGISNANLSPDRTLEPIVTMGSREGLVKRLLKAMFTTEDVTSARCAMVEDLPEDLRELTTKEPAKSLWGFPGLDQDGQIGSAIIVARSEGDQPTASEQKMLTQFAELIARAGDRQTAQLQTELATSQALYDQLTRLPNRSLLLDRLEQATARLGRDSSPLAVLMIDIDNFRSINNTYGADLGDEILIEVAARIHNSVRLGDTVGRIGSDQFVLICVATNGNHDVAGLARRISRSISEPIDLDDGNQLFLTASIGIVVVDDERVDPTEIVSQAESALMTAMQSGRGHYAMFDREHQRHNAESQTLEQALHRAIMNEELLLHYQPVFGLETGQMVGAEALVRWTHPEEGLVSPAAFMDLAEESGLIIPMGDWIINKAAEASASWPEAEGRFPIITVNLSARQMTNDGLVTTIEEALRRYNLPPNRLGFEITESARILDLQQASDTLGKIAALGCRVAIDDFGIGHATLDYLRRFSMASAIKIDRSFTDGLATSREDAAIIAASIAMATALGMQVVAEGVETQEQLRELRQLGCDYAQGFLLSRPVAFEVAQKIWLIDTEEPKAPLPTQKTNLVSKHT